MDNPTQAAICNRMTHDSDILIVGGGLLALTNTKDVRMPDWKPDTYEHGWKFVIGDMIDLERYPFLFTGLGR